MPSAKKIKELNGPNLMGVEGKRLLGTASMKKDLDSAQFDLNEVISITSKHKHDAASGTEEVAAALNQYQRKEKIIQEM